METKEYLEKLHRIQIEILDEIVRICDKHNLRYYLTAGTMLGAVRHKGFIPWDDDVDVDMPREDYEEFCKLCKTELNDQFFLHNIESDDKYWLVHGKVRKNGTFFEESTMVDMDVPKGIFVDIFPLDEVPKETSCFQRFRKKRIRFLTYIIFKKRKFKIEHSPIIKFITPFIPFSIKTLDKWRLKLMKKQNGKNCGYYVSYGSQYDIQKMTILKSKFDPPCELEFEGKKYKTMGDYKYFLKRVYGEDYMQIPPQEKRVTHRPVRYSFGDEMYDSNID